MKKDYKKIFEKNMQRIEDMNELLFLTWLLIFDTNLSNDERVEKI